MKKIKLQLTIVLFSFSSNLIFSQPGALDLSFDPGLGAGDNWIQALAIQSDGKIVLGGSFTTFAGVTQNRIVRVQSDGSVDNSFYVGTGASSWVTCLDVNDTSVFVGGQYSSFDGANLHYVSLLNTNGSFISLFYPNAGPQSYVNVCKIQSDGHLIVGGIFSKGIMRMDSYGNDDGTFNTGTGTNDWVQALAIQSDGKILIGGHFTSYNGITRNRIARLNTDGTIDNSFDPLGGANQAVRDIQVQPNGKIIVVGEFTTFNGISKNKIVRLNSDGSIDNTFDLGTGAGSGDILTAKLQSDGKLIIGGNFYSYNGTSRNAIARLNSDGSLDTSFDVGSGADGTVRSIGIQPDGKILIAGSFTSYNGVARNRLARLNVGVISSVKSITENKLKCSLYPNPSVSVANLAITFDEREDIKIYIENLLGETVKCIELLSQSKGNHSFTIPLEGISEGVYNIVIVCEKEKVVKKLIVGK